MQDLNFILSSLECEACNRNSFQDSPPSLGPSGLGFDILGVVSGMSGLKGLSRSEKFTRVQ